MQLLRSLTMGLGGLILSGCSSIVSGTSQDVVVNTNPEGAECRIEREGIEIGRVFNTPGSANISKTKHDITIFCDKEGYHTATYINDSGWESGSGAAGIALDVILTLGISSAIDSATGADNKYESPVNITLVPLSEPKPEPQTNKVESSAAGTEGEEADTKQ
jgi:hypothetical protein